ncbi:MAG TPA: GH116 family glycosyl-hydrolase, partial [Acidobacteriota bacterium]|nr:GH116 family glycosyl-hydrolase [Acidobacteriota bacterium]
ISTRYIEGPLAYARGSVALETRKNDEQNSTFSATDSMTKRKKIDRRKFLATTSGALVAATTVPGRNEAAQASAAERSMEPATFHSSAGSLIPFRHSELLAQGRIRTFSGEYLGEIAFPLGGIGTGTVSLGGRGDLRDWEIFNRPNKGKALPFTFVALWTKLEEKAPVVKVVEAAPQPPFRGPHGYARERAQGLPHLQGARFTGTYPFAQIEFEDKTLPVSISLEAFNPFIPLETDDSALPVAIFRYRITNHSSLPVDAALAFSILNPIGYDGRSSINSNRFAGFGRNITRLRKEARFIGLEMISQKYPAGDVRSGSMALVTTHPQVSARTAWEGGAWWDSFQKWFDEYAAAGAVNGPQESAPSADGVSNYATLAPQFHLKPAEERSVEFLLAWYFPTRENYWNSEPEVKGQKLRNYYATQFRDAWHVTSHTMTHLDRLEKSTRAFQRVLFSTTIPSAVIDAVSSQLSIIRTNTCMLLEGKQFFAFEGTNDDSGCCPLNCTHVWNYEQALAHLFPELERSMRVTDFKVNLREDGSMAFRTLVPLGPTRWKFKPAADGQMGCVLKLYREWQISGDDGFLRDLWPAAKQALEYAWKAWDVDRDGVMEGEQHNTYDIEFYGPNTMMGTLYLGALRAAEKMARAVGDNNAAEQYRRIFELGRVKLDRELWRNGYYVQRIPDPKQIQAQRTEHKENWYASSIAEGAVKYQYGDGCLSDQLLGQWFAAVVGLGHLLPAEHVRQTLLFIYRNNFKHSFYDHPNTQRIYALGDDKGLLLCSWPRGNRPLLPFVYSDEVWTGIEYQVAAHLIYEGFVIEGLAITKAARDRYDGRRRNPWNEVECGSHYARALSSWSLLTALSGYRYSAPEARLAFAPRIRPENFRSFFTTGLAWGVFRQTVGSHKMAVLENIHGELPLQHFRFGPSDEARGAAEEKSSSTMATVKASVNRHAVAAEKGEGNWIDFHPALNLRAGDTLVVRVTRK